MAIRKVNHRISYRLCPWLGCLRTGVAVTLAWHSSGRQPCSQAPLPCALLHQQSHGSALPWLTLQRAGIEEQSQGLRRGIVSMWRILGNSSTCEEKLFKSKDWTSRFTFYEAGFGISFPLLLLCWMSKVRHSFCYASLSLINNLEVFWASAVGIRASQFWGVWVWVWSRWFQYSCKQN